jgi:hypothetical protein
LELLILAGKTSLGQGGKRPVKESRKVHILPCLKGHPDKILADICTGIQIFIISLSQSQALDLTLVKSLIISETWFCHPSLRER